MVWEFLHRVFARPQKKVGKAPARRRNLRLSNLPQDVQAHIASFLPDRNGHRLAVTSKEMLTAVQRGRALQQSKAKTEALETFRTRLAHAISKQLRQVVTMYCNGTVGNTDPDRIRQNPFYASVSMEMVNQLGNWGCWVYVFYKDNNANYKVCERHIQIQPTTGVIRLGPITHRSLASINDVDFKCGSDIAKVLKDAVKEYNNNPVSCVNTNNRRPANARAIRPSPGSIPFNALRLARAKAMQLKAKMQALKTFKAELGRVISKQLRRSITKYCKGEEYDGRDTIAVPYRGGDTPYNAKVELYLSNHSGNWRCAISVYSKYNDEYELCHRYAQIQPAPAGVIRLGPVTYASVENEMAPKYKCPPYIADIIKEVVKEYNKDPLSCVKTSKRRTAKRPLKPAQHVTGAQRRR